jgi:hypothetical protein
MNALWNIFVKDTLDCIGLTHIVEIGAAKGQNTKNLLEYCRQRGGARLTSIDCVPSAEVLALGEEYKDIFTLEDRTSLEALPELSGYEAILIDGDHNWYTVYHELKEIEKTFASSETFPVVFFHDIAWPYGRRDLYYSPERIPDDFRNNYQRGGILPGQSGLSEEHGMHKRSYHAVNEGGPRNGVLTAVEDFISGSQIEFRFAAFDGFFGYGFLASVKTIERFPKLNAIFEKMEWSAPFGEIMQSQLFDMFKIQQTLSEAYKDGINAIYNSRSFRCMSVLKKAARYTGILFILRAVFRRRR